MEVKELKEKWKRLNPDHIKGFRSLRITGDSKPDIYIGLDEKGNQCLILKLPTNYRVGIQPAIKENLSLEMFSDKSLIVLKLFYKEYADLFDDLIISLFNKIKEISDPKTYTQEFIQFFYKWSEFFSDKVNERLSEEKVKGLFGEVLVLNQLLAETNPENINDVLTSWRGPYDAVNDFIQEHQNLEVKTKDLAVSHVHISSEFQLEPEQGKVITLIVVDVSKNQSGASLKDLLNHSRELVTTRLGNISILLKAIFKKGLTFQNLHEYDVYRFVPRSIVSYRCDHPRFPKIIRSALPNSIDQVSYSLRTDLLEEYIINKNYLNGSTRISEIQN
jgi:hypothetical protein